MNWPEIESVVYSECDHPQNVCGRHDVNGGFIIQCFFPGARNVYVKNLSNDKTTQMEMVDEEGFFACLFNTKTKFPYDYLVEYSDDLKKEIKEVYNYVPMLWTNLYEKFAAGIFYDSYRYFGAHVCERKGILGTEFICYAPNASRVSVVGDFNDWDGRINQMCRISEDGIFAVFLPDVSVGSLYKYEIKLKNGLTFLKRDPYAFSIERGRGDASRIIEDADFEKIKYKRQPLKDRFCLFNVSLRDYFDKYKELDIIVEKLIDDVKRYSYTGILFDDLSVCENKDVTDKGKVSFFAVCPDLLRIKDIVKLIDALHSNDIRVFSTFDFSGLLPDDGGLKGFDGKNLYELEDNQIEGIISFDYNKAYVRNYLISVCDYFTKILSLDGICIDGLDRILYLDYGKGEGNFIPNMYGGNENLNGIEFIKHLNSIMHKRYSNFCTIAMGSMVSNCLTLPLDEGGYGFDYKIHALFDKDLMTFLNYDDAQKPYHYNEITYSPVYIYCERFILSYLFKDYGCCFEDLFKSNENKDNIVRLIISYLFLHPGRKCLSFSACENVKMQKLISDLVNLYTTNALDNQDDDAENFKWVNAVDSDNCVFSFLRKIGTEEYLVVCNFSNAKLNYNLCVEKGVYKEIFSSEQIKYGGSHRLSGTGKIPKPVSKDNRNEMISFILSPYSLSVFQKTP